MKQTHASGASPWPMLIALIASVPAFYDSMRPTPATWATWMYLASAAVLLGWGFWGPHARLPAPAPGTVGWHRRADRIDMLLGLALGVSAVLPQSNVSEPALVWRLVLAVLMLYRLVQISLPWLARTGLGRLLLLGATVLGLCGVGFYWLDPRVETLNEGLWLAFSTAATVGYGDVVPSSTASRIFSVFVVLLGYGVLSLVTASIAAVFVGSQERKMEAEILRDLHTQLKGVRAEIAALRSELASHPARTPDPDPQQPPER